MILECDRRIGAYFRQLYEMESFGVRTLKEPLWGTHVSVIRDEQPEDAAKWKELEGMTLPIQYSNQVQVYGSYAFVEARCEEALIYRETLGLSKQPEFPLHMTIGNLKSSS